MIINSSDAIITCIETRHDIYSTVRRGCGGGGGRITLVENKYYHTEYHWKYLPVRL